MSITLYSADACPYCVRTRLVLDGKGIEYDLVQVDLPDKPAWLRELNPRNRVPVLDVDGQVLWESEALNDYLDETHPQPAMMPSDPVERARVRIVLRRFEDLAGAFYAARREEDGAIEALHAELAWVSSQLEHSDYLVGDSVHAGRARRLAVDHAAVPGRCRHRSVPGHRRLVRPPGRAARVRGRAQPAGRVANRANRSASVRPTCWWVSRC